MDSARQALLVLLLSALAVVGCASWMGWRVIEPVPAPVAVAAPAPAVPDEPSLLIPVKGVPRGQLRDNFLDKRGMRTHKALDIMARRGTLVVAADDGPVARVYRHPIGGLSVYQYDTERRHAYYYAHLDGYAKGLQEGVFLKRGDPIGYVGTTGNASRNAPHLHFAMYRLGPERKWHRGEAVNPFPYLRD